MPRAVGLVGKILGPIAVALVVWILFLNARSPGLTDANAQLMTPERDGGRVHEDKELAEVMAGDLTVPADLVVAAMCVNSIDWTRDVALNLDIVVATDARLVRAAELYAAALDDGDERRQQMIGRVEDAYWDTIGDRDDFDEWVGSAGNAADRDAIELYLDERARPPSADALRRFVVYAVSASLHDQLVMYLDTSRLTAADWRRVPDRLPRDVDVMVAGQPELVTVTQSDCETSPTDGPTTDVVAMKSPRPDDFARALKFVAPDWDAGVVTYSGTGLTTGSVNLSVTGGGLLTNAQRIQQLEGWAICLTGAVEGGSGTICGGVEPMADGSWQFNDIVTTQGGPSASLVPGGSVSATLVHTDVVGSSRVVNLVREPVEWSVDSIAAPWTEMWGGLGRFVRQAHS